MIKDRKLGLKMAENKEEALFEKAKETAKARIQQLKNSLILEKMFLKAIEKKLS